MSIFLAILKWIGIALGGIVGLALLLVAAVLFVPVRYYIAGHGTEEGKTELGFRVSFLLRSVMLEKKTDSDQIRIRICGIPVGKPFGGEKPEKEKTEKEKTETEKTEVEKPDEKKAAEKSSKKEGRKPSNGTAEAGTAPGTADKTRDEKKSLERRSDEKTSRETKKKQSDKKKSFSFETVSSIIKEIRDRGNRRAVRAVWGEFTALLRYLAPKKVRARCRIGTGDPSGTGLLFGGISLMPFAYAEGVQLAPDFENKVFCADGYMKGRMRTIYLVRLLIRLYRNRDIKRLMDYFMKKEAA